MRTTRSSGKQRGSAMLESALILTVFLFMLIAIMDFAQFLFVHQSLAEIVRRAARYGVVNPGDLNAIRNVVMYDQTTVPENTPPRFGLTSAMVVVQRQNTGELSDRLIVTIRDYPFAVFSPPIAGVLQGLPITASLPVEER